jgi:hypothetical protein
MTLNLNLDKSLSEMIKWIVEKNFRSQNIEKGSRKYNKKYKLN